MNKKNLRFLYKKKLNLITSTKKKELNNKIITKIINSKIFTKNKFIGCYYPSKNEVDIKDLFKLKKKFYIPSIKKNRNMFYKRYSINKNLLHKNKYGIYESNSNQYINIKKLRVIFVPIQAFNKKKFRLGMGGGYYDQTFKFKNISKYPILIGLAFEIQLSEIDFQDNWDIKLDKIITEKKIYK